MSRLPNVSTAVRTASARCSASPAWPATGDGDLRARPGTRPPRPAPRACARSSTTRAPAVDQALRDRQSDAPAAAGHQGGPPLHRAHAASPVARRVSLAHGRGADRAVPAGPAVGGEARHSAQPLRAAANRSHTRLRAVDLRDTSRLQQGRRRTTAPPHDQHDPERPPTVGPPTSGTRQGLEREGAPMPAARRTLRAAGLAPAAAAPARLRVGVIGAGRVGAVLGAALAAAGHDVVAASGLSTASAERAARLLPGVPAAARRRGRRRRRPGRPRRSRRHPGRPGRRPRRDRRLARRPARPSTPPARTASPCSRPPSAPASCRWRCTRP